MFLCERGWIVDEGDALDVNEEQLRVVFELGFSDPGICD